MQKKYYLLALIFALISATAMATLPEKADAQTTVRFYIYPETPIAAVTPGGYVNFEVRIESPPAWDNTADGIVGWALSLRGDPRALEPNGAGKMAGMGGFLEAFLVWYGYDWDYVTAFYAGEKDLETCTFFDISEQIQAYSTLGVGAGGSGSLGRIRFKSRSDTIASVIDIFGPPTSMLQAQYLTVDGVWHDADVVDDGYYIAETPDAMYFDCPLYFEENPTADPLYTDWHELWPTFCQNWTLESWDDQGTGVLDESDQIDLVQTEGADPGLVIWGHVDWVNPTPVAGDGKADLIIDVKPPVPEYPLGLELIMAFALMTPLIYLWRRKRW